MGNCHPSLAAPLHLCPFTASETGARAHVCSHAAAPTPPEAHRGEDPQRLTRAHKSPMWYGREPGPRT